MIHSAGWLERGLSVSYENIVADVELLNMVAELCADRNAGVGEIRFANALSHVATSGHFFSAPQTMQRYSTEFHEPIVHDHANFGTWTERDAGDTASRATAVWEAIQARPRQAAVSSDRPDALRAFIDKRTMEFGAPPKA